MLSYVIGKKNITEVLVKNMGMEIPINNGTLIIDAKKELFKEMLREQQQGISDIV